MKTDAELRQAGRRALIQALGTVEAEWFIAALPRDRFDYTEWRKIGLPEVDLERPRAGWRLRVTTLNNPHDRFFKAVFGRTEVAAEFLGRYLPPAASIDRLSGDELRQAVTQALSGGGELMRTIAEQWEQQGGSSRARRCCCSSC